MNLAINDQRLTKPGPQNAALRDYDSVRRAIAFISEHWRAQPTIESMADAAGVTPDELHHLFRRWAGPSLILSRSLVAIAGPAINLLAGASRQNIRAFLAYDTTGRVLWVAVYGGLGYAFASNPVTAADLASSVSVVLGLGGLALLVALSGLRASGSRPL